MFLNFQRNLHGVEEDAMDIAPQPPAQVAPPPSPVAAPVPAQPPAPAPLPPPAQIVIGPGVFGQLPPLRENCIELRSGNVERRFQGGFGCCYFGLWFLVRMGISWLGGGGGVVFLASFALGGVSG